MATATYYKRCYGIEKADTPYRWVLLQTGGAADGCGHVLQALLRHREGGHPEQVGAATTAAADRRNDCSESVMLY